MSKMPLSRRAKNITISYDEIPILVPVKHRLKAPFPGDQIILYMPEKAPVYDRDGGYHIHDFYTLEIIRKVPITKDA